MDVKVWFEKYMAGEPMSFSDLKNEEAYPYLLMQIQKDPENAKILNLRGLMTLFSLENHPNDLLNDILTAVHFFKEAIEKGNTDAMCNLAGVYYHYPDYHGNVIDGITDLKMESIRLHQLASEQGHMISISELANIYHNGDGVAINLGEAIRLYVKAIEKGHTDSMYQLAMMYLNGEGLEVNPAKAIQLYQMASQQHHIKSMYHLAQIYFEGTITKKNLGEAIRLYEEIFLLDANNISMAKQKLLEIMEQETEFYITMIVQLRKDHEAQQRQITELTQHIVELEYMPEGVGYQQAKEEFEEHVVVMKSQM